MIVIVRHGNTFEKGTKPRRIGARTDLPLTAEGIAQSALLGSYFANRAIRFDQVLVSPLARAQQTAQRILAAQDNPPKPQIAEFLREIDYGPDENQFEVDVRARLGADAIEAWEHHAQPPQGWIVQADVRLAAWRALLTNRSSHSAATLLVTSNGAARFALLADPDLSRAATDLDTLKLPTGGLGILAHDGHTGWQIEAWGIRP